MAHQGEDSKRRILKLSYLFYAGLLLTELAAKGLLVFGQFSGHKVTSSLVSRAGGGTWLLIAQIVVYVVKVIAIYMLFAYLNGQFVISLSTWLKQKKPRWINARDIIAFTAVNLFFVLIVYGINASYYPSSALAPAIMGLGLWGSGRTAARIVLACCLALYTIFFLGFVARGRGALRWVSLTVVLALLVAPLDLVHIVRQIGTSGKSGVNTGPNVVFIGLDSLNPRHTGHAGYPLPITPNLDRFLGDSIVFRNAYTPIARTFPSWYSILTGQYPKTNGVRLNLMKRKYIKSPDQCLGHILRKEGYSTTFITDEVRFSNITAADGFDRLSHPPMGIGDFIFGTIHDFSLTNVFFNNPLGSIIFPFLKNNRAVSHLYDGRYFVNSIVDRIKALRRDKKFFLVAHLCLAHWPYIHASPRDFEAIPGADPNMLIYDSAVFKVDQQLGQILDALRAEGLYDQTIVVVLSDHGESAGGHGSDLKDSEQNRTLLAWKPAGSVAPANVDTLVRTVDIAPTVLDLIAAGTSKEPYDGASLKPLFHPSPAASVPRDESVFMETEFSLDTPGGIGVALQSMIEQGIDFYEFDRAGLVTVRDEYQSVLIHRRNRALLTPDWKLISEVIIRGAKERLQLGLYDIRNDPWCLRDVSEGQPLVFRQLWDRMSAFYGSELPPLSEGSRPSAR